MKARINKVAASSHVNRVSLARTFGITVAEVDKMVELGCPYIKRAQRKGDEWVFDTAAVARWREDRAAGGVPGDAESLRLRKLAADAAMAEMELLKARGDLAPISQMERVLSRVMAELQGSLRGPFVMRCATQLIGKTDERKFKRVLLGEVDACLEVLADMDVTDPDEGGDSLADGESAA